MGSSRGLADAPRHGHQRNAVCNITWRITQAGIDPEGLQVTGAVDYLATWYASAKVVAVPTVAGTGLGIKRSRPCRLACRSWLPRSPNMVCRRTGSGRHRTTGRPSRLRSRGSAAMRKLGSRQQSGNVQAMPRSTWSNGTAARFRRSRRTFSRPGCAIVACAESVV